MELLRALISLLVAVSLSSIVASDQDGEDNVKLRRVDPNEPDTHEDLSSITRIVGGDQAARDDYPYYVYMGGCGGALVAPDVVLFAAHCGDYNDRQVIVNAYKFEENYPGAEGRFCAQWIADPEYSKIAPLDHDFALCKLDQPVKNFNEGKVRIELNFDDNVPSNEEELEVMGFGVDGEGDRPTYLQNVTVNYISNSYCDNAYSSNTVTDTMLCAGIKGEGGKDSCQGDSGGPLVRRIVNRDDSIVYTHVGVVSWGIGCASASYPGVYARTSKRAGWIKDKICNEFNSVASYCNNPPVPTCHAQLTVKVGTDRWPGETSWTVKESSNQLIRESLDYGIKYFMTESDVCLETNKCYTFEITDDWGDGLCYGGYCGSYSLLLNGEVEVTGDPGFGGSKTHTICTHNVPEVTDEPSNKPTQLPTIPPTKIPTQLPTTHPTKIPTQLPTTPPTQPLTDPRVCMDNADFAIFRTGQNCTEYVTGSMRAIRRKCRRVHEGYRVRNYWCRQSCAEGLKISKKCFAYSDAKIEEKIRVIGDEGDKNNIFKRSKKPKSG